MPKVAITGSLCSGKSETLKVLKRLGVKVLDIDHITLKLYRRGAPLYKRIVREFGGGVLGRRRNIDRSKLAQVVFSSSRNLNKLNKITHPALIKHLKDFLKRNKGDVAVEVPLLFEKGLDRLFDCTILVKSPRKLRISRARNRGLSLYQLRRRLCFQMPEVEKARRADFIINNNKTKQDLKRKVVELWRRVKIQKTTPLKKRRPQ